MQRYPKNIEDGLIAESLEHENCLLRIKIITLENTIASLENRIETAEDHWRHCDAS